MKSNRVSAPARRRGGSRTVSPKPKPKARAGNEEPESSPSAAAQSEPPAPSTDGKAAPRGGKRRP